MRNLVDSNRYQLSEINVPSRAGRAGQSAARSRHRDLILAVVHEDQVMMGVNNDPALAAGDQLLVLSPSSRSRVRHAQVSEPPAPAAR
jgi:hypothetical protein